MNLPRIDAETCAAAPSAPSRRAFLGQTAAALASGLAVATATTVRAQDLRVRVVRGIRTLQRRQKQAYQIRVQAAQRERDRPVVEHQNERRRAALSEQDSQLFKGTAS